MSMRYLSLVLTLLLVTVPASAQALVETATPESVGMSSDRLGRLDALMEDHIEKGHFVGGLSMVFRRGEVVHFATYGNRDREHAAPMSGNTLFRIYSMSKPITSTAIMMLYEEGHFQLGTPVSAILPEFADLTVYDPDAEDHRAPLNRPVTIEDLLTHTAGLTYGEILGMDSPVDSMYQEKEILWGAADLEGFVTDLGSIPLRFQPGERWHYSVGIDVLGRIVEVVSGQPFDEYLQEHVFGPLGMDETGFSVAPEDSGRFAVLYQEGEDGLSPVGEFAGVPQPYTDVTFFSGGGGLVSTADDYLRFTRMLLNGGELDGVRLLSPKTVDLMMQNHLSIPFSPGYGFGLGGQVVVDVAATARPGSVGAFSWSGAAKTYFFIDPEEELIAFAWTQLFGRTDLHDAFRIAVYQAIVD
jgi:CubicO group peptidase (beta-lactamase class C family)